MPVSTAAQHALTHVMERQSFGLGPHALQEDVLGLGSGRALWDPLA